MTRDDVIRLAREACDTDKVDAWHNGFWTITQEELERFAALVIEKSQKLSSCNQSAQKPQEFIQDPAEIRRVFEIDEADYPPPDSGFAKL